MFYIYSLHDQVMPFNFNIWYYYSNKITLYRRAIHVSLCQRLIQTLIWACTYTPKGFESKVFQTS